MTYALVGAVSGLMMASAFVSVGVLMLFFLVKDPPPALRPLLRRTRPAVLTIGLVVLAYPVWSILGAVMGLLLRLTVAQAPGGGMGSPNLAFSLAVLVVGALAALLLVLLLRRVVAGVAALALTFVGLFGWLLPHLAK